MSDSIPPFLSLARLADLLRERHVSPVEVARAALERIAHVDSRLNAYLLVTEREALASALTAEAEIRAGRYRGPLHGVPFALKDLFLTAGVRTTAGSRVLAQYVPDTDATVVARLREAGAVLLGKLNMHEFAFGVTNVNPHYGAAHNPWDIERITGGSSGGSGAALAAGLCAFSLGTDTGGSVRIPAALCGVTGLKPTYGRISRFGVLPLAWSLDHVGPMARSALDAALVLQAVAGRDPRDDTSSDAPVPDYASALQSDVRGLRVGVPWHFIEGSVEPEVMTSFRAALDTLAGLGASVTEVALPRLPLSRSLFSSIVLPESVSVHERYMTSRADDYGPDVRARLEAGLLLPAARYLRAQRIRRLLQADFRAALAQVDVIMTPTCPMMAPRIGEETVRIGEREESVTDILTLFTRPVNLVGLPAVSTPCGFTTAALPVGLQVVGRAFDEATVLRVAHAYEQATAWGERHPPA